MPSSLVSRIRLEPFAELFAELVMEPLVSFCQTTRPLTGALLLACALLSLHCGGSRRRPAPPAPLPAPAPLPPTTPSDRPPAPHLPPSPEASTTPTGRPGRIEARQLVTAAGQRLPYLIYTPERIEPGRSYPLTLLPHSASGSPAGGQGDPAADRIIGLDFWTSPAVQGAHPSFVIAPLADREAAPTWVRQWRPSPDPSPDLREPLELADELVRDELPRALPIDPDRLYVAGYSMGGFGAWIAIARSPALLAAPPPIAGRAGPTPVGETRAAVWAFHGSQDAVVPADRSRAMVDALKRAGRAVRYTEIPDAGHQVWAPVLETEGLADWLFEQRRSWK